MRRFAALIAVLSILAFSFAFFVLPASAASTTCYRATATFTNNNDGPIGEFSDSGDVVVYAGWSLHTQNDVFVDLIIPEEVMVRHGSPKTIIYQAYFDSSLKVTYVYDHSVFFTTGHAADSDTNFSATVTSCSGASSGQAAIIDGRINATDLAAPAAIYCAPSNGLDIWDIDAGGHGSFGFHISQADIDAGLAKAKSDASNISIGQWGDKSLFALYSGQLMLVGHDLKEPGKVYQAILPGNICA